MLRKGVLKQPVETEESATLIDILIDPTHSDRMQAQPGPLVFYSREEARNHGFAVYVADVLLSRDERARMAAPKHLERTAPNVDHPDISRLENVFEATLVESLDRHRRGRQPKFAESYQASRLLDSQEKG